MNEQHTCANCKEILTKQKRRKIKGQWKKFCDHCVNLVDADRAKYRRG